MLKASLGLLVLNLVSKLSYFVDTYFQISLPIARKSLLPPMIMFYSISAAFSDDVQITVQILIIILHGVISSNCGGFDGNFEFLLCIVFWNFFCFIYSSVQTVPVLSISIMRSRYLQFSNYSNHSA